MPMFAFSEQKKSEPSKPERDEPGEQDASPREQEETGKMLERLKEDAHVYGWEFDEEREVFRPIPAI